MKLRKYIISSGVTAAISFGAVGVAPVASVGAAPTTPAPTWNAPQGSAPAVYTFFARRAVNALTSLTDYSVTGNSRSYSAFAAERNLLAADVATSLMIEPWRLQVAWAGADLEHQVALLTALTQLGVPYRRNTSKPGISFDCSGLTLFAWNAAGSALPRNSRSQINAAQQRTRATAQAGDLVYYPGHIMMWLGVDDAILHSPLPGRTVEVGYVGRGHKSLRFADPTG